VALTAACYRTRGDVVNKKNSNSDMFGIPVSVPPNFEVDEAEVDDDDEEGYIIRQIIPADGSWRAAFEGEGLDGQSPRLVSLVCFALVEVNSEEGMLRVVRPMIADELGRIDDVEAFEGFMCLVPPGALVEAVIAHVQRVNAEDVE